MPTQGSSLRDLVFDLSVADIVSVSTDSCQLPLGTASASRILAFFFSKSLLSYRKFAPMNNNNNNNNNKSNVTRDNITIIIIMPPLYRMRHKSINSPLSHERLVGSLQDGGRGTHVTHFVQLYPQPLYTASQVCTTCRSWDEGVLTDLCLTRYLDSKL